MLNYKRILGAGVSLLSSSILTLSVPHNIMALHRPCFVTLSEVFRIARSLGFISVEVDWWASGEPGQSGGNCMFGSAATMWQAGQCEATGKPRTAYIAKTVPAGNARVIVFSI